MKDYLQAARELPWIMVKAMIENAWMIVAIIIVALIVADLLD